MPELVEIFMRRFPQREQDLERAAGAGRGASISTSSRSRTRSRASSRSRAEAARSPKMFTTAPSPGIVATTMLNAYYDSHEDYLDALAREMQQRISGDPRGRADPADRRARSRDGTHHDVPGPVGRRVPQGVRAARRTRSTRRSRASRATACGCMSAGATGRARTSTTSRSATILPVLYQANVGALSIEFANPRHAHEYDALKRKPAAEGHAADPRRDRNHQQFRRASRSGGAADRGGGGRGRRPRARHRLDRLRLRHLRRPRMGGGPVVWKKLKSLREGADIASSRLWGKQSAA